MFYRVGSTPKCSMDYKCLAIVFGPTIVGVSSTSLDDLQNKSEIIFKVNKETTFFKYNIY